MPFRRRRTEVTRDADRAAGPVPAAASRRGVPDRGALQVLRRRRALPGGADHLLRLPRALPAAPPAVHGARPPPPREPGPAAAGPGLGAPRAAGHRVAAGPARGAR